MEIKKIIKQIKNGKLSREIDETGANGFWDFAYEITQEAKKIMLSDDYQELVEVIYNALWEVYENNK